MGKGQIKVIDRCKNHFKLQQGVFVAPGPLEEIFRQSQHVRQIFVWGNGFMSSVAAVVVPAESIDKRLSDREQQVLDELRKFGCFRF